MDPATIASIISSAISYFDKQSDSKWKNEVSSKLDEISSKLDVVIAELNELKVWIVIIDGKVSNVAPSIFKNQVEGNRISIESIAPDVRNGTAPSSQRDALIVAHSLITQAFGSLYDWNQFGFTYYSGVFSGVLTQLYAGSVLRFTKSSMSTIRIGAVEQYFSHAIAASNPKSIEHARLRAIASMDQLRSQANSFLGTAWLSNYDAGSAPSTNDSGKRIPGIPSKYVVTVISGSIDSGFTYSREQKQGPGGKEPVPWFPGLKHFDVGDGESSLIDIRACMDGLTRQFIGYQKNCEALQAHVTAVQNMIDFLANSQILEKDAPEA
ncbi:hypothetical protein FHS55_002117 [Angulomicrobium tetraedrale]|uniref:Uncharacterized protein n=1 Tax=Ancylobacter tetraedralis TaxID=217068 RepID=A0A839Z9X0_9HYPH|nr:hypothetical protein [Ancylobacter tetraedralis]MBB3771518.1 hypothetical protein [Ancylobacter tetraedralis]